MSRGEGEGAFRLRVSLKYLIHKFRKIQCRVIGDGEKHRTFVLLFVDCLLIISLCTTVVAEANSKKLAHFALVSNEDPALAGTVIGYDSLCSMHGVHILHINRRCSVV